MRIKWLRLVRTKGIANMSYIRSDDRSFVRNQIFANLPDENFRALKPHLQRVEIKVRSVLQEAEKHVKHVHFIEHGLPSRISSGETYSMETAMVGRFGYTGSNRLGIGFVIPALSRQLAGGAWRIQADRLS